MKKEQLQKIIDLKKRSITKLDNEIKTLVTNVSNILN